ncbi:uncharacterized protein MELLADRAFT_96154 [Melampsora larici-populina 98AG31]|uniref:Glycosyltransferase family 28 N-terminal domain-containing protein n=1 Tax=Melampsora larici-populina (strain 98AG31 / pathotype 3-4-7) TaxID=747676 RepID=F4SB60_MELLP|nr:uncharacterized protein MELLADRAFT_96154 [Melampsora larici-populina 98AG31]EGF98087.1 hypothetical protein MELLADRAFT_96154 [Melampsora larici-populina 98AG31]
MLQEVHHSSLLPAFPSKKVDHTPSAPHITPPRKLKIACLTIGTRGDVEPYIPLCNGLKKEGHLCKIATHAEFKDWIESYGSKFASIGGSSVELIKHATEYGQFEFLFEDLEGNFIVQVIQANTLPIFSVEQKHSGMNFCGISIHACTY